MSKRTAFFIVAPFLLTGIGLLIGGYFSDPSATIDTGQNQRVFLFFMGGVFTLIPLAILVWLLRASSAAQQRAEDLLATGEQGEATVLALEDTGRRVNDSPQVNMHLEIRIEGHSPYQVWKTLVVPLIRLPQVQVGQVVQVLADPYEPDNPDKVGLLLK